MYRNLFLLLFVFSAAIDLKAGDVLVQGHAPEFAGKQFQVHYPSDFLSQVPITLGAVLVDDSGNFAIDLSLPHTARITFESGAWYSEFYVESGRSYSIRLFKPKTPKAQAFDHNRLVLVFDRLPADDPNAVMDFFYRGHDSLISAVELELAVELGKGAREALKADSGVVLLDSMSVSERFEALKNACEMQLGPASDPFTGELLEAALGQLALTLGEAKQKVYLAYMQKSPDLKNPEVVALFRRLHAQMLNDSGVKNAELLKAIETGQLTQAMAAVTPDYALISSDLERELLVVHMIQERWFTSKDLRKGSLRVLDLIEQNSISWSTLAGQMRTSLVRGTPQAESLLPPLVLLGLDDQRLDLRSLNGEVIYLSVVSLASAASTRELAMLESVARKFGRQVRFITVVVDEDLQLIQQYLSANRNQNWTFLLGGMHPELRYYLRMHAVPAFYLISPDGQLLADQTRSPSEGIHDTFVRLFK
jgi:hypothetical protein